MWRVTRQCTQIRESTDETPGLVRKYRKESKHVHGMRTVVGGVAMTFAIHTVQVNDLAVAVVVAPESRRAALFEHVAVERVVTWTLAELTDVFAQGRCAGREDAAVG